MLRFAKGAKKNSKKVEEKRENKNARSKQGKEICEVRAGQKKRKSSSSDEDSTTMTIYILQRQLANKHQSHFQFLQHFSLANHYVTPERMLKNISLKSQETR